MIFKVKLKLDTKFNFNDKDRQWESDIKATTPSSAIDKALEKAANETHIDAKLLIQHSEFTIRKVPL